MLAGVMVVVFGLMFAGCEDDNKPAMPVGVTFRESAVGQAYVAQFQNLTNKYLAVRVKFKNKTLNHEKEGYIELSPYGKREIGWAEGWKFFSGETIHLSHEDYESVSYRIP